MPQAQPLPPADLYVGTARHLEATPIGSTSLVLGPNGADLATALERIAAVVAAGKHVCVLAGGDPGFFGVGRALAERFGPASLEVHPDPPPSAWPLPAWACRGTTPSSCPPRAARATRRWRQPIQLPPAATRSPC